jgi:hypothetical protein
VINWDPPSAPPSDREYDEQEEPVMKQPMDAGDFGPGLVERFEDEGVVTLFDTGCPCGDEEAHPKTSACHGGSCRVPPRISGELVLRWVKGENGQATLEQLERQGWSGHHE